MYHTYGMEGRNEATPSLEALLERAKKATVFEDPRRFEGKAKEVFEAAANDAEQFLAASGFPDAASRIRYAMEHMLGGSVRALVLHKSDGTQERVEGVSYYDWANDIIAITESRIKGDPYILYKTFMHELMHFASFRNIATATDGEKIQIRIGFHEDQERPEVSYNPESTAVRFLALNEGMTETLVMLASKSERIPDSYYAYRYLVQVLLRALVAAHTEQNEPYTLQDAWNLLTTDYFNGTSNLAPVLDSCFGTGTAEELANIKTPGDENRLLRRLAPIASLSSDRHHLDELRNEDQGAGMNLLLGLEAETKKLLAESTSRELFN